MYFDCFVCIVLPHLEHGGDRFEDTWRQGEIEEPVARALLMRGHLLAQQLKVPLLVVRSWHTSVVVS